MLVRSEVLDLFGQYRDEFPLNKNEVIQADCKKFVLSEHTTGRFIAACSNAFTASLLAGYSCQIYTCPPWIYTAGLNYNSTWVYRFDNPQYSNMSLVEDLNFTSKEEIYKIVLLNRKVYLLDLILTDLAIRDSTYIFEPSKDIYLFKYNEAQSVLAGSGNTINCPFLSAYANFKNISLKHAAEDFMVNYSLYSSNLAQTELARLNYIDSVQKETNLTGLQGTYDKFSHELYSYTDA